MKQKTMKKIIAFVLTLCLAVPTVSYRLLPETQAADTTSVTGEVGDTDGDGTIDSAELVRIKKGQSGDDSYKKAKFDLNNDGKYDETDAKLMREFLCGKICSFYRPDTSALNNGTQMYTVTDGLDREMAVAKAAKADKKVGIRYFLHFGAEESNPLYSVSEILKKDSSAYETGSKWVSAGGGAVGTKHWWGEPLFGYYFSTDAWVADRDVQMLTDAGIDFIAIDTSEDKINEAGLTVLLEALNKYYKQGFNVPKVAFTDTTQVAEAITAYKENHADYNHLWYKTGSVADLSMETVHVAENCGVDGAMSASAFYGATDNLSRDYDGSNFMESYKEGYNFAWQFEDAIASGKDIIFVDGWNEWISERKPGTEAKPIVLEENADANNSSDIQPMKGGYGDSYYTQLVDYVQKFKGTTVTNNRLNTASEATYASIDMNGDFNQWNKVNNFYLDYTGDIADRNADAYEEKEINHAAAIEPAKIKVALKDSLLISKKKYPAGSKITCRALYPEGVAQEAGWWGLYACATYDSGEVYAGASKCYNEKTSSTGIWADYTFEIPDGQDCYLVFIAPPGNEFINNGTNLKLLIDNITITNSAGTVVEKETFENGLDNSIFTVDQSAVSITQGEEVIKTNKAVSIEPNKFSEAQGQLPLYTKEQYPKGSTVTFRAFVPSEAENIPSDDRWWGFAECTDTGIGVWDLTGKNHNAGSNVTFGTWADYSFTIEKTESCYLAFIAYPGSNKWMKETNLQILVDSFTITKPDGTKITETFDEGLASSIFNYDGNAVSLVEGEATEKPKTYTDNSGRNDIAKMKMTADGTNLYCFVETVDAIQGWGTNGCMSLFLSTGNDGGCWNQYEYVVNRDSSKATADTVVVEKYVGGEWKQCGTATFKLEDNKLQFAVPLSVFHTEGGLSLEFKWADNYGDSIDSFYTQGDVAPYGRMNYVYEVKNKVAALTINKLNADAPMNFITKKAYTGGSTVSFRAYVPAEASWWAVCWTTDPSNTGLYKWTGGEAYGKEMISRTDQWADYSVTLPDDGQQYYVYIVGAKGEWPKPATGLADFQLLIEDFEITTGGTTVVDTFDYGFETGLFDVVEGNLVVELQTVSKTVTDKVAAITVDNLNVDTPMNFITQDAYPAGSTVSFRAYVPEEAGASWWRVAYVTTPESAAFYGSPHKVMSTEKKGTWADYSVTIPEGEPCYIFIVGAKGEWNQKDLLVDHVRITNPAGELIAKDDFNEGFEKGIFNVVEKSGGNVVVSLKDAEAVTSGNKAAAITSTEQNEKTAMATKKAYAGGSTITFDARLPENLGSTWWHVAWTTDANVMNQSIYSGEYQAMSLSYKGEWTNYTVTLPEDSGPYYIYFKMEQSGDNWPEPLQIDNFKVMNASGRVIAKDNFDKGFDQGLFQVNASAVALVDVEEETAGDMVDFTAYAAPTVKRQVSEADQDKLDAAYAKLSEAGFSKAIALYEGYSEETGNDIFETIQKRSATAEKAATTVLDIAEKHNVQYYVRDWSFYGLGKNGGTYEDTSKIDTEEKFKTVIDTMFSSNNPYIKKVAYAGNFAYDEPTADQLKHVAWQMKYYKQNVPNGEMFVNLAPHHKKANTGLIGGFFDDQKYEDYLTDYFDNIAPTLGYVCFDHYPLKNDNTLEEMYYNNLQVVANKCKGTTSSEGKPIELRTYVQATGDSTGLRNLNNIADLRFQIYSGMAFGVKEFIYYSYASDTGEADEHYSLFNQQTQEYTWVYDAAKKVNNEVHGIEKNYLDYGWQQVMYVEGTEDLNKNNTLFRNVTNASSLSGINSVSGTQDTLVGAFTANNGTKAAASRTNAYMVVNASNPTDNATNTVTMKFDSASAVSVCKNGKQTIIPISSNQYTFMLNPGEGAFIIPLAQ